MADELLAMGYDQGMREYDAAAAEVNARALKARADGDPVALAAAGRDLARIAVEREAFHRIACEQANAQAVAPQANEYGLSDAEVDAARATGVTDEEYARGKVEMQRAGRFSWQNGMGRG